VLTLTASRALLIFSFGWSLYLRPVLFAVD
jgi:hypothetical protein